MAYEDVMKTLMPLLNAAEALGALAAAAQLDERTDIDPEVRTRLDRVVAATGNPALFEGIDDAQRQATKSIVISLLKQTIDLATDPARPPGWSYTDPEILIAQGQGSAIIPMLWAQAAPGLDGLEDALARDGALVLDVGSGIAALAISCCRTFPATSVHGIDPYGPSMEIARKNVAAAGLDDRITLRDEYIQDIGDRAAFDLAWLPPFIPPTVLAAATAKVAAALRPGGWLIFARYAESPDPMTQAIGELRTIRGGGAWVSEAEAIALLTKTGLENVHAVRSEWPAPIRFVAGQRAEILSPETTADT